MELLVSPANAYSQRNRLARQHFISILSAYAAFEGRIQAYPMRNLLAKNNLRCLIAGQTVAPILFRSTGLGRSDTLVSDQLALSSKIGYVRTDTFLSVLRRPPTATAETPTPAALPLHTTSRSRPTDAPPSAPAAKKSRPSPPTTATTTTSTTSRLALAGLILAFTPEIVFGQEIHGQEVHDQLNARDVH
ncbi:hypothetical protein VE00_08925 [Pseudogymnoascus sp. WSF 3629]|nr:hypothetical protein VE00_08925 [Pseudogymnoascus sp. WSF 3629]